jgi:hypothetical protein
MPGASALIVVIAARQKPRAWSCVGAAIRAVDLPLELRAVVAGRSWSRRIPRGSTTCVIPRAGRRVVAARTRSTCRNSPTAAAAVDHAELELVDLGAHADHAELLLQQARVLAAQHARRRHENVEGERLAVFLSRTPSPS